MASYIVTDRIRVNIIHSFAVPPRVKCEQYDGDYTKLIQATVYNGDVLYKIPSAVRRIVISGLKADGNGFSYDCTWSGTTVYFSLMKQMTAFYGDVPCNITMFDASNNQISSAVFVLDVEKAALPSEDFVSSNDFQTFIDYVQAANLYAQYSKSYAVGNTGVRANEDADNSKYYAHLAKMFKGSPLTASTISEMVDVERTYVYIGNESGYNNGHWYYYNDSEWADGGVYNSQGLQTDKDLLIEDVAADAKATGDAIRGLTHDLKTAFLSPQMYGAKGNGVHDDTDAFVALANEVGGIFIPKGNYVINQEITIANVIGDYGTYTNYKPMYKKHLELPLDKLSVIKEGIALNIVSEYEESIAKIGNRYYVITNSFDDNTNGIIVYDENFDMISHTYSPKTTVGTCNSCCTDGVYLYVDYDGGYHRKYDPVNLSTPILEVYNNYRNTCYYNKSLYAINITTSQISVSKLSNDLTTLTDTWNIATTSEVLQSATIHNGIIYIPTTYGNFRAIDIVSHEILSVKYNNQPVEIETFFDNDGELCVMGHIMDVNGKFNISAFNGGISYADMKMIEIDASETNFIIKSSREIGRNGFYHVINGKTANILPSDDAIVMKMGANIICFSVTDNLIYAMLDNTWRRYGLFREVKKTISLSDIAGITGSVIITVKRDLSIVVTVNGVRFEGVNNAEKTDIDLSDIYELCGFESSKTFLNFFISPTYNTRIGGDIYAVRFNLEKTAIRMMVKPLLGVDQTINAWAKSTFPILY